MKTRKVMTAKARRDALEWPTRIVAQIKEVEEYAGAKYPDGHVIGDLAWGDSPRVPVRVGDLRMLARAIAALKLAGVKSPDADAEDVSFEWR